MSVLRKRFLVMTAAALPSLSACGGSGGAAPSGAGTAQTVTTATQIRSA